jgi:hypothetical protein
MPASEVPSPGQVPWHAGLHLVRAGRGEFRGLSADSALRAGVARSGVQAGARAFQGTPKPFDDHGLHVMLDAPRSGSPIGMCCSRFLGGSAPILRSVRSGQPEQSGQPGQGTVRRYVLQFCPGKASRCSAVKSGSLATAKAPTGATDVNDDRSQHLDCAKIFRCLKSPASCSCHPAKRRMSMTVAASLRADAHQG